jgi:hypothetical protein
MGWIEAVAELLAAVAWPAAAVAIVLLLRSPITERIRQLRSLKWREAEAHFNEATEALGRRVEQELAVDAPGPDQDARADTVALRSAWDLVDLHPRGAVLEAWLGVEAELFRALDRASIDIRRPASGARAAWELTSAGLLGENLAALVRQLQGLRNEAVHTTDFELSSDAATTYVATASMLAARLADIAV